MADIGWRTINGTHVYLSSKGTIMKGPASLVGQKAADIKNQSGNLLYLQSSISAMSAKAGYKNAQKKSKEEEKFLDKKNKAFERAQREAVDKTRTEVSSGVMNYNGYNIPSEYFDKGGRLNSAGKKYYSDLIKKDPTKATQTSGIKTAFASDFKKVGITDSYVIGDACSFIQKGHSFEESIKLALELDAKFSK